MRRKWGVAVITLLTLGLIAGCASNDKVAKEIKTGSLKEQVSCHDPQIIVGKDGKYYMFGSHTVGVKSDTLSGWEYFANGNNLFSDIYSGDLDAFKFVGKNTDGGYSIWASNVIYNESLEKYVMYFCTTSSYIKSNLCMAVADEAD